MRPHLDRLQVLQLYGTDTITMAGVLSLIEDHPTLQGLGVTLTAADLLPLLRHCAPPLTALRLMDNVNEETMTTTGVCEACIQVMRERDPAKPLPPTDIVILSTRNGTVDMADLHRAHRQVCYTAYVDPVLSDLFENAHLVLNVIERYVL